MVKRKSKFSFKQIATLVVIACFLACSTILVSCGGGKSNAGATTSAETTASSTPAAADDPDAARIKDGKGAGKFTDDVTLSDKIDAEMTKKGKAIFDSKCAVCHNLTKEKKTGPGLLGVTGRRKPEWIMNMILSPDVMTQKDPTAKDLLAEHATQMTNQNVEIPDARNILEFFRENDAKNKK